MIRAWKKELWKALHNPLFYTALAIGLGVALTDVVQSRLYADEWLFNQKNFYYLPNGVKWGGGSREANGLFDNWIGAGLNNLAQIVYYVALPLLAAMAYGWAELTEKKERIPESALRTGDSPGAAFIPISGCIYRRGDGGGGSADRKCADRRHGASGGGAPLRPVCTRP